MRFIISRYNQDIGWFLQYPEALFTIYDRSEIPLNDVFKVPNIGTDLYDKFTFIINNYDNLPDVAIYTKANLFKYITKEEFDLVKDNITFTPLLTQNHKEVFCDAGMIGYEGKRFSYYENKMYYELNYPAFLKYHPLKDSQFTYLNTYYQFPLLKLLGIDNIEYLPFAPGSNYILPKENILKHPKEFYQEIKSYLEWDRYPGEAMIVERALYTLWS